MKIEVKEWDLKQINSFGNAYIHNYEEVSSFFDYHPHKPFSYQERLDELRKRPFDRESLAKVIANYMDRFGLHDSQKKQLERLASPNSVIVIGGQQAGLLLGPLYSIYKIITILQLAKQKEAELNIPVIPVFWIAGEDHDWQEVNHVFIPAKEGPRLERIGLDTEEGVKSSLSDKRLDKEQVLKGLEKFFESQPTTEFTADLYKEIQFSLDQSTTYVDFFSHLLQFLFSKYGLLFIDSGDTQFRSLETDIFKQIIKNYNLIDQQVRFSIEQVVDQGFEPQIVTGEHPALLFIIINGERLLLEKKGEFFLTKNGYSYTEEELLDIATTTPWALSNNVITRPFMQERLFPTLAFVGGPGEIAYWALLKNYFNHLDLKLPIVAPRIGISLIDPATSRILEKKKIELEHVFGDFDQFKKQWLSSQDQLNLEAGFESTKQQIEQIYQPLISKIGEANLGLEELANQNLGKILEQVQFLEKRALSSLAKQHETALKQFDKVEQMLLPHGKPQERMFNFFTFLNKHGMVLVDQLVECKELKQNGIHKVLYIG